MRYSIDIDSRDILYSTHNMETLSDVHVLYRLCYKFNIIMVPVPCSIVSWTEIKLYQFFFSSFSSTLSYTSRLPLSPSLWQCDTLSLLLLPSSLLYLLLLSFSKLTHFPISSFVLLNLCCIRWSHKQCKTLNDCWNSNKTEDWGRGGAGRLFVLAQTNS